MARKRVQRRRVSYQVLASKYPDARKSIILKRRYDKLFRCSLSTEMGFACDLSKICQFFERLL